MKKSVSSPRRSGRLLTFLTDGLLLFLTVVCVIFCVLTVYGLEADHRALLIGCGAGCLLWLSVFSLPRFRLPSCLLLFGGWCWGLWRLWEPMSLGSAAVQCGVVNTWAKKLPAVAAIAPVTQLPEEAWPLLTTLWLLMAGFPYILALAFLLLRLRRALPVILFTLLPILPALCVTEAPDALPMCALLTVWLTLLLTAGTAAKDPAGTARLRPLTMGAVWGCLALLFLVGNVRVVEGPCQPSWAAQARADAYNAAYRMDFSALLSRFDFFGWRGSGSTQYVSLTGGGASRTGRITLRVHTDEPGKHYLRGYSADVYTGTRWEPLGRADRQELTDILAREENSPLLRLGEAAGQLAGYIPFYSSHYRPAASPEPAYQTMTVENVGAPGGCAYYPYALTQLPEGASFGEDSHLRREGQVWEHTYQFLSDWEESFLWAFYSNRADGASEESSELPAYRDFVYDHYLQVPEDTRKILLDWLDEHDPLFGVRSAEDYAKMILWHENNSRYGDHIVYGSAENLREKLWMQEDLSGLSEAERASFRAQFTLTACNLLRWTLEDDTHYDMDTPAPPSGEDYVNWFLNESKQGYCMHYATAGALLLRTLGVPARYVSGYVVNVPRSGNAAVPDSAAHAWVEVYYDGVGWYPVDFTPGFQWDGTGTLSASDFFSEDAAPEVTPTPRPTPAVSAAPTPSAAPSAAPSEPPKGPDTATPGDGTGRLPLWPFVTAALLILTLLGRYLLLERRRKSLLRPDPNAAVLWAWHCHQALIAWGGQESEDLTALAQKARFSRHTLTEPERQTALTLLEQETRRVYTALPGWKKPLFRARFGKRR